MGRSATDKILVVGPAWVGDMVMAQALFKVLKDETGCGQIDVVGPPWSLPVTTRMPEVTTSHGLDVSHGKLGWRARRALGLELRSHRYDRAIVIPATLKSALVPFWARIPTRTGYRGEHRYGLINDMRPLDKELLRSTAERYCALGLPGPTNGRPVVPAPTLRIDSDNARRLAGRFGRASDKPVVALCPGAAFGPSKRWSPESFGRLAATLIAEGNDVWVLGSSAEAPLAAAVVEFAPAAQNLCGHTSLVDAIDLLSMVDATVSNDSGLMHLAAASGSPVVALYGSTPPWFAPPLTDRSAIHYTGVSCSPCFDRNCRLGHHDCMTSITPAAVAADVAKSIERGRSAG